MSTASITVHILLFAALRDAAGTRSLDVDLPAGATVRDLRDAVARRCPPLQPLLGNAAVAVNEEYAGPETIVRAGDTAALIPPVSGG